MRNPAPPQDNMAAELVRMLVASGCGPRALEAKVAMLQQYRAASPGGSAQVDRLMVEEIGRLHAGLESARSAQAGIRETIDKLTAPPWFHAVFLSRTGPMNQSASVRIYGGELRAVGFGETDPDEFQCGDEVLLSSEKNFIISKTSSSAFTGGETAPFVRYAGDGRLVIRWRDAETVVLAASSLRGAPLKEGDLLRFDHNTWVAYERIERQRGEDCFLEETPRETFEDIGGLDAQAGLLKRCVDRYLRHPEIVRKYKARAKKSVLLYGRPGSGKTLLARALANYMGSLSLSGRSRFISVKPGELHSMWYGKTEENYRAIFRVAREAGEQEPRVPVVLFWDEIDSIAGIRGRSLNQIDDRITNAFMAELNGLVGSGNILVVTATNRLDALDPAMVRAFRLGDLKLHIPHPGRKAARQVFEKHLPSGIPFAAAGYSSDTARQELIDTAVSMIFSANGESELAHIMFRDGKRRVVRASDMISGAEIASIAQSAVEAACDREIQGGESGVRVSDLVGAVSGFFASAARVLTPANCRSYLDDLPQDVDVVRVDPVERKVSRPYRYVNAPWENVA